MQSSLATCAAICVCVGERGKRGRGSWTKASKHRVGQAAKRHKGAKSTDTPDSVHTHTAFRMIPALVRATAKLPQN